MVAAPNLRTEADWHDLRLLIRNRAVLAGPTRLSSGLKSEYYLETDQVTLTAVGAPLVGRLMCALTADWRFEAAGGLTTAANPIALAMTHIRSASGRPLDTFVVRAQGKTHGLEQRVEGPSITSREVVIIDVNQGGDPAINLHTIVKSVIALGAIPVGIAALIDTGVGSHPTIERLRLPYRAVYTLADLAA